MTAREKGWLLPPAAVALTVGVFLGRLAQTVLPGALACACSLAAVCLMRNRGRWIACLVLMLSVGAFTGFLSFHPSLPEEGEYWIQGIVTDEIRTGDFGQHSTRLSHVTLNGKAFSASLYWSWYTDEDISGLIPGCFVRLQGDLYHPGGADNPDGYDFREELLRRGIRAGIYGMDDLQVEEAPFFSLPGAAARCRYECTVRLMDLLGEEKGAYAATMLLGSRSLIPSEDRAAFAKLGIAHLLSVSGFHVGVLYAALTFLLRRLYLSRRALFLVSAAVLAAYCLLCGMNQPVLRASVLVLLSQLGRLSRRPVSPLHLLSAVYLLLVLLSPVQITGVSFQLTFGAMLGMVLVSPGLTGAWKPKNGLIRRIWEGFSMTFGVQIGILVPQLATYQQFPLLTFLVNTPAILLGSGLILLFWLLLILLPIPPLASLIAAPVSFLTGGLIDGVRALSALPGINLWTPAASFLTAIGVIGLMAAFCPMTRFRLRSRLAAGLTGLMLVIGSLLPTWHGETEYIQFSAGNADAAVLWDQDQVYVYDTGTEDGIVSGFLRRRRLTPTAVILSHLHADHAGGLRSMLDDGIFIPILYLPEGAEQQEIHEDVVEILRELKAQGTEFRTLRRGDEIAFPSGGLTVLWPEADRVRSGQDANDYSLVSLLTLRGTVLLETGDLTGSYEPYISTAADILKAPHHGSASSSTAAFLQSVHPATVLLTCGKEKRAQDYQARLTEYAIGSDLYATVRTGAITLRFRENAYEVVPHLACEPNGGETP